VALRQSRTDQIDSFISPAATSLMSPNSRRSRKNDAPDAQAAQQRAARGVVESRIFGASTRNHRPRLGAVVERLAVLRTIGKRSREIGLWGRDETRPPNTGIR
jgi:hypothetical protein